MPDHNTRPDQARTVRCSQCGGTIEPHYIRESFNCPYCAHHLTIPAALVQELQNYERRVGSHLRAAHDAAQEAAIWRLVAADHKNPRSFKERLPGFAVVGIPLAVGVIGTLAAVMGLLPAETIFFFLLGGSLVSIFGGIAYGLACYSWSQQKRLKEAKSEGVSLGNVRVACPSCGAIGELTPGDAVDACRFCRAGLMPAQTAVVQAIDDARLARRRLEMEKYRLERSSYAAIGSRYGTADYDHFAVYAALGFVLLFAGGPSIVGTFQMLFGSLPFHPLVLVGWPLCVATILAMRWYGNRRAKRHAQLKSAVNNLARQFSGTVGRNMHDCVLWLNQYWVGPYDNTVLTRGTSPLFGAIALNATGYPALIEFDLVSVSRSNEPRLNVLLSADVPDDRVGANLGQFSPTTAAAVSRLSALGFDAVATSGGLQAIARSASLSRYQKTPEMLHEVATVMGALVELAQALGVGAVAI